MKLKRPQLVPVNSVVKLLRAAEQALQRKDYQQSLELLEHARQLDPANPAILLQMGRSHGLRYNHAAAEECFEKAIELAQNKTQTMAMAGEESSEFFNPGLAERYFERAAEQKDATIGMLVRLAEIYEIFSHRMADARQMVERALQKDPRFPRALFARARLERQAGHLEDAEKLLRSIPATADAETRGQANYHLAAILDRRGRYDEAMAALIEAKAPIQVQYATSFIQRQILGTHMRELLTGISAEMFQRWFDFGRELQPPKRLALLSGHPRSGTTLLEQVLDAHPDIISAEETETFHDAVYAPLARMQPPLAPRPGLPPQFQMAFHVELSTLQAAPKDLLLQLRGDYFETMERCLAKPIGDRLLVDKNPWLHLLLLGFQRVFPEVKLMVALRDPRDVCMSTFMHYFGVRGVRHTAYLTLKDTVEQYVEEMSIWRTIKPMIPGHYLEVRYEDLVEDLESVARRTLEYLGVPWNDKVLQFHERARQKTFRMPNYGEVTKPIFKTARGRWRNYQKYLEPYLPKLEPLVKAFGYE